MSEGIDSQHKSPFDGQQRRLFSRMHAYRCLAILAALMAIPGCGNSSDDDASSKINGSIHVPAGQPPSAVATVNGSVNIDDNAAVTTATTVNGSMHLGAHATAAALNTVNGAITLDAGAQTSGNVESINGDFTLRDGAEISGMLSNVNGKISLTTAHVAGGIKTVNGNISITGASHVEGGIRVEKSSGDALFINNVPRIVIGPGASVQGELHFERKVQLFVSDRANIGPVTGATPIAFSGEEPPR